MEPWTEYFDGDDSMQTGPTLSDIIKSKYEGLTAAHKNIGTYVAGNIADAAFMNIQELAKACKVSEASVVRFARALGFAGYPELKSAIQSTFLSQVNLATKLDRKLNDLQPDEGLVRTLLENELEQLTRLPAETTGEAFKDCVSLITSAENLVIYGEGSCASLTYLMEFRLRRFGYNVTRINESGKDFFERVMHFPKDAVAVALGLGRPSEELVVFLSQAKKNGMKSILITDSMFSFIAQKADLVLCATRGTLGVFHSLLVPTLMCEALILGVALKRREDSIEALKELDRLRNAYGYPRYAGLGAADEER